MIEETNTSRFTNPPAGVYEFTVVENPEKRTSASGKSTYRIWQFMLKDKEKNEYPFSMVILPWQAKELLLALGGTPKPQNPDIIKWNDEEVINLTFDAELVYEPDNNGKDQPRLKNISDTIPFG